VVTRLRVDGPLPALAEGEGPLQQPEADEPVGAWAAALETLLENWV
jgi:hypothetical protein